MKVTALMLALVAVMTAAKKTPSLRSAEATRQLKWDVDLEEYEAELNDDEDDMIPTNNSWNVIDMDMRDEDMLPLGDDDVVLDDDEMLGVTLNDDGMAYNDDGEATDDDGVYGDDEYVEEEGTRA